jgi:hypothetical protein
MVRQHGQGSMAHARTLRLDGDESGPRRLAAEPGNVVGMCE